MGLQTEVPQAESRKSDELQDQALQHYLPLLVHSSACYVLDDPYSRPCGAAAAFGAAAPACSRPDATPVAFITGKHTGHQLNSIVAWPTK